jgi:hypothetical protein
MSVGSRKERKEERKRERWSEESERGKRSVDRRIWRKRQREEIHTWREKEERERGRIPTQLHTRATAADARIFL